MLKSACTVSESAFLHETADKSHGKTFAFLHMTEPYRHQTRWEWPKKLAYRFITI